MIEPAIFEHLDVREKNGYQRHPVEILFDQGSATGVVYVAPPDNFAFLGQAPLPEIATHINRCCGPSGTNREYLFRLARALREIDAIDPHVFQLERLVRGLSSTQPDFGTGN